VDLSKIEDLSAAGEKNKDISLEERNRNRDFGTSMCDLVGKFSVVSRLFSFKEFLSCIAQS
jgi:hypothetical protein